jgi:hypothetical protein
LGEIKAELGQASEMTQTITRLYDSYDTALQAMLGLRDAGFTDREVSVLANRGASVRPDASEEMSAAVDDAGTGASIGGVIGTAAGLMAGLGVIAIPGIGPVVAAGWLASALAVGAAGAVAGGATGGLVGALIGGGATEEDAQIYADGVRRGDSLVTVRVPDERAMEAAQILSRYDTVTSGARLGDIRWEQPGTSLPGDRTEPVLPAGLPSAPPR